MPLAATSQQRDHIIMAAWRVWKRPISCDNAEAGGEFRHGRNNADRASFDISEKNDCHGAWWSDSNIRISSRLALLRMLESKDH
jgi:hypothetical protein